mgnify:CR=1 FL=1
MKVRIVTWLGTGNFGTSLQSYALHKKLQEMGYSVSILHYFTPDDFTFRGRIYKWLMLGRTLLSQMLKGEYFSKKQKKIRKFNKQNYCHQIIKTNGQYKCLLQETQIFITGSDQVWNGSLVGYDDSYFLHFVKDGNKKGSYAASFGFLKFEEELKPKYRELLQNYKYYNIRETSGVDILKDLFDVDANVTVDPTLLVDKDSWSKVANNAGISEPYILVYQISPSGKLIEVVKQLKKQTNLKVVAVPFIMGYYFDYTPKPTVGPSEWVGLFQNASYVVTDSFHGTTFSMIFNRNVWCCIPENESRINSFLSMVGIPERLLYPRTAIPENLTEIIPFGQINIKLGEIREQGLAALRTMVYENK